MSKEQTLADEIQQACNLLTAAYEKIVSATDSRSGDVDQKVFQDVDPHATETTVHKIAVICRRLEYEMRKQQERMR
jgi:hypothetical protein